MSHFILIILTILFTIIGFDAFGASCDPGRALAAAEWASLGKVKHIIAIEPFENQSKDGRDKWLSAGLAELLGDYLSAGKRVGVVKGLVRRFPPAPTAAEFIITGAFQKDKKGLRVFVKVISLTGKTGLVYQSAFSISPPNTGHLFVEMEKMAMAIFKSTKLGYDRSRLAEEAEATANYRAYESYIKGLEAMWKFSPNYLDVALIWFKEARRYDLYFQRPYLAEADIYGYLSIKSKSEGRPYTPYLEKLESIENARLKFMNRPAPIEGRPRVVRTNLKPRVTNRFLSENAYYLAGMEAMKEGDLKKAKDELTKALKLVPEDTAALRSLSSVYSEMGDVKKAGEVMNRISTEGMCQ